MRPPSLAPGERIRVARVIARLNVGGPAIHVTSLCARLPAEQFESRLYTGQLAPGEAEMSDVIARTGVEPQRIVGLGRALRPSDDLRALAALVRSFRRFRPHIVHSHTAKAGALARVAARLCNVPVVVHTFHGHVFDGYFSPAVSRGFVLAERALARATDRIVAISPRQAEELASRYCIAPAERFSVIPLGFDFSDLDRVHSMRGQLREELGLRGARIVSVIGRLTAIKDHALLFESLARSKTPDVHLLVVGGGELEADLRRLAGQLGIAERVSFLGFRPDVARILADTEVLALTSKNEGTPVAVIEALAAGCCVVASNVGGVADVLSDSCVGRLVDSRSPETFAHALDSVLSAPPSVDRLTTVSGLVRKKYSLERLVNDHVELYSALLSGTAAEHIASVQQRTPDQSPRSQRTKR